MKEQYLQEFKNSGISDELVSLNFRELKGDEIYEYLAIGCQKRRNDGRLPDAWLKLYRHCESGGWWCSGVNVQTGNDNDWGCFKPDSPRMDAYALKPIKYEHPKGVDTDLFALKIGTETAVKIGIRYGFALKTPRSLWDFVIENSSVPIIITEGAKKAASLLSHGFIAIALPGIWGGYRRELKTTASKGLIPALAALADEGREFIFAFDQDAKSETRAQVKRAITTTSKILNELGCEAKTLFWPEEHKGADDLLVALGEDYFANLLEPKQVETSTPLSPAREYQEVETEYPFTEEAVRDLYNHGGRYVALDGTLYKFNGTHYERLIPELEKIRIRQWTSEYAVYDPKTKKQVYRHMNPRSVNSIWDWALLTFSVAPDSVNPPGVNLANGVLKIEWQGRKVSWKLVKHNPDVIYTYCSDVAFDPNANPEQCDRLLECLDPAPRTAMLRQIAASLDLANVRKLFSRGIRAGIARGAGSNGKDSLKEAVGLIFGSQVVSVTLSDFKAYDDGRKFYLAKLKHGTINWASENNKGTSLDGLDALNICVTGDKGLDIEEKNKQPTQIQPQAIHIFNVNRLPKIASGLDSILSRFVVYDFNKTFKSNPDPMRGELLADPRFKEDPKFLVEQVCPALLNRLLAELDAYTREGIDYDSIKHSLDDIQEESTHLWTFAKDVGLGVDSQGKVYVGDLWETLKAWYVDNGTLEIVEMDNGKTKNVWNDQANKWDANISGPNQIYKRMKLLFPKIDRIRETKDCDNKGRWFLSGISLNPASLASLPYIESLSASPSASFSFTSSLSASQGEEDKEEVSEAKSEAKNIFGEAESPSLYSGEAREAKNAEFTLKISQNSQPHKQKGILESGDEAFIYMINLEKARLYWDTARLRDFARETVGAESFESMTPAQKMNLIYALRKEDPASLN